MAEGFRPFFYIMVEDTWNIQLKDEFLDHLKEKMGFRYQDSITKCKLSPPLPQPKNLKIFLEGETEKEGDFSL